MKYANIYKSVAAIFRDDLFLDEPDFFKMLIVFYRVCYKAND